LEDQALTITSKIINYLVINLAKEVQVDLNKQNDIQWTLIGRLTIVKVAILTN